MVPYGPVLSPLRSCFQGVFFNFEKVKIEKCRTAECGAECVQALDVPLFSMSSFSNF